MNYPKLNTKLITTLGSIIFMPSRDIIAATDIATSTWYTLMQKPADISIQQLLAIANGLHIPVRRMFSFGHTDICGRRDDYISDPYLPCSYDAGTLQNIVSTRTDATWKLASQKTGMTPSRLRNSLLGATRTPVMRFLTVCETFEIDPFSILIDPNPDPKKNKRTTESPNIATNNADLRADIDNLNKKMENLNDIIANLNTKYEALLAKHELLEKRVRINSVNIEQINNDGFINISTAK